MIDEREYHEINTTAQEREEIRRCVRQTEPGVVYCHELPYQTLFSIDLLREELDRATADFRHYVMVVDLSRANMPSARIRQHLRKLFSDGELLYVAVFTGRNAAINIAARMVLAWLVTVPFEVFTSEVEALGAARAKLLSAEGPSLRQTRF